MTASILAVDDSASIRMAVRIALSGAGYAVTEAGDGAEGLAKLKSTRFDMVVTDLNMPNMDGLTMIRESYARQGVYKSPRSCIPRYSPVRVTSRLRGRRPISVHAFRTAARASPRRAC